MSAFPGSKRSRELYPPSEELPIPIEAFSRTIDRKARVDSPYFKSHSSAVSAQESMTQKAKDFGTRIVRETQSLTPRLHSRDASVSPPRLKRSSSLVASAFHVADSLLSFEDPKVALCSPSLQASQLSTRNGEKARDIDLLHINNPKLRGGPGDDNSSNFSGETCLSGSTNSEKRKTTCYYCKSPGHANMPLTLKCSISSCQNKFHDCDKCLNATVCEVKGTHESEAGRIVRCIDCIKEGKSNPTKPLLFAEASSRLLQISSKPVPSANATTKSPLPSTSKTDQHSLVKANVHAQPQDLHNDEEEVHVDAKQEISSDQRPSSPTGSNTLRHNEHIPKHDTNHGRSLDMSNVPKGPAAMRKVSSPTLHRTSRTNSLLDSYRPDRPGTLMDSRGTDSYKPLGKPRPPPVHHEKERERFLRHAPKDERDKYLEQNRTLICKEITCPRWLLKNDCRHDDKCMYAHKDTGSYWPSPNQPSRKWTCCFWKFGQKGCVDREDDCLFAHYDTGIYADRRGTGSMKHAECFWWSKNGHCSKGEDCSYAHRYTGMVADDPRLPRHRTSFEQNPRSHGPQPPVRRLSDSRQHQSSMSRSSPPLVRDTPLSPVEPSELGSEEYEPPSVRQSPSDSRHTESNATSTHPLPPQSIIGPQRAVPSRSTTTATDVGELTVGPQPGALGSSMASVAFKDSKQDFTPREAAHGANTSATALPKQYARRTGGVRLSHTRDPQRRRPESTSLDPLHNSNDVKSGPEKSEAEMQATNSSTNFQPVEGSSSLPKCQMCQKYVLVNQAANHKCQPTLVDQACLLRRGSGDHVNSRAPIVIDDLPRSRSRVNSLSTSSDIPQQTKHNVNIGSDEMGHVFSITSPESSLPRPTFSGLKRAASGSEADAMFIPNKKRRMGPPSILRAVTSTSSLGAAQALGLGSAMLDNTIGTQLSISDLTELEALRKEFVLSDNEQLLDDAVVLEVLRLKKRLKLASEKKARAMAEAAEKIERLRAEAAEEEAAADAIEKSSRDEELAQLERNRQERKERERSRAQARLLNEPRDEDANFSKAPSRLEAPPHFQRDISARTPLPTVRGVQTACPVQNGVVTSSRHNSVERLQEQEVRKRDNPAPEGISSAAASVAPSRGGDPVVEDKSELIFASSDEDVQHDEQRNGNAPKCFSFPGPKRVACEPCRKRRMKCRHSSRSVNSVVPQQQMPKTKSDLSVLNPTQQHNHGDRPPPPGTNSVEPNSGEKSGDDMLKRGPRARACVSCTKSKRGCIHDPVTGQPDPARAEQARQAELAPRHKRQGTTSDPPESEPPPPSKKSTAPHSHIREPMLSSIDTGVTAMKTATNALSRTSSSVPQEEPSKSPDASNELTAEDIILDEPVSEPLNAVPGTIPVHPAASTLENGKADVAGSSVRSLNLRASLSTDLKRSKREDNHTTIHPSPNDLLQQVDDDGYPRCNNCPNTTRKRIRRWNGTDRRLCDPCYMYLYYHGVDKPIQRQETILSCSSCGLLLPNRLRRHTVKDRLLCNRCYRNRSRMGEDRPLDHHETNEDQATDDSLADDSNSLDTNIKLGAGLTYPACAPNCIAPDEIQRLFYGAPLKLVQTSGGATEAHMALNDYHVSDNEVRLIQTKVLSKEEKAAEIASMRADGIEVISVNSDSDNSWGVDDEDDELATASWLYQPVSLVQNARYEQEPDPRRWVDKAEDLKSFTFDPSVAEKKIEARQELGLKANVKARQNGKKPGKLLAMSDWQGRIRKYGSVHRETERDPGPQKKGTFIRDMADRTLLTLPRGFDDETVQREKVEGTMREFLGILPGQMRYDLIGAARLVQARTLAFSDATGRRVSDKEKFPVGMGG